MKRVTAFQTSDGELHATKDKADRHAKSRYDAAMSKLVANMSLTTNIGHAAAFKACEFLEANFPLLGALADLKADADHMQTLDDLDD